MDAARLRTVLALWEFHLMPRTFRMEEREACIVRKDIYFKQIFETGNNVSCCETSW